MRRFTLQADGTVEYLNGSHISTLDYRHTPLEFQAFYILEFVAGRAEALIHWKRFTSILDEHWRANGPSITDAEIMAWLAHERTRRANRLVTA